MIPATIGPILGPPVGGFIVTYLSWHWIFYINVPIGVARHRAGQHLHRGDARSYAKALRHARSGAVRHRAGLPAVRHRDGQPWRRCAHRPGPDRRWRDVWHAVCLARQAPPDTDPGFPHDADRHVPHVGDLRLAVAHQRRSAAVPVADDDAAGFRHVSGAERIDHLRQFDRVAGDAADRAGPAAPASAFAMC